MTFNELEHFAIYTLVKHIDLPVGVDHPPDALITWRGAISFLIEVSMDTTEGKNVWLDKFLRQITDVETKLDKLKRRWLDDGSFVSEHSEWFVSYAESEFEDSKSTIENYQRRKVVNNYLVRNKLRQLT